MEHKPFLPELTENQIIIRDTIKDFAEKNIRSVIMAVSYTHLTLPTSDLV